ncbi:Putative F-box domain-containing protein [Septoria linicola]|uniref:F-box domain-containing protein n=1 Tax=Septoria linicola TaxID=215465 RepID=A0A9Q9ALF5_9PEZI|nr:Putative F-box domain-containing protein [Septoria linicola]
MAEPSPSGIKGLPPEMIEAIADELEVDDIIPFRSTCKAFAAAADDRFLDVHFTERKHLVSDHSLTTLAAICNDPRLRRRLVYINLLVAAPDPATLDLNDMSLTSIEFQPRVSVIQLWNSDDLALIMGVGLLANILLDLCRLPSPPALRLLNQMSGYDAHEPCRSFYGVARTLRKLDP